MSENLPPNVSTTATTQVVWPPMPWAWFSDGEHLGWTVSWRMWKSHLLPYRTAEFLGYDEESFELILGPWEWHAPCWFSEWRHVRRASERTP